jgi:hypothetical protein
MMKNVGQFLEELRAYDATQIDEDILAKLSPIVTKPFFNFEDMTNSSEAAANLCNWVVNIVKYNSVYKVCVVVFSFICFSFFHAYYICSLIFYIIVFISFLYCYIMLTRWLRARWLRSRRA